MNNVGRETRNDPFLVFVSYFTSHCANGGIPVNLASATSVVKSAVAAFRTTGKTPVEKSLSGIAVHVRYKPLASGKVNSSESSPSFTAKVVRSKRQRLCFECSRHSNTTLRLYNLFAVPRIYDICEDCLKIKANAPPEESFAQIMRWIYEAMIAMRVNNTHLKNPFDGSVELVWNENERHRSGKTAR